MRVFVCTACLPADPDLLPATQAALPDVVVSGVACMSGCTRPQTVGFRAAGKTAYLFGEITVNDMPDLVRFAELYDASDDGNFADARVLGDLRLKALARIPG